MFRQSGAVRWAKRIWRCPESSCPTPGVKAIGVDESEVPTVTVNDGVSIPQLGFRVFQIRPVATGSELYAGTSATDAAIALFGPQGDWRCRTRMLVGA